MKRSSLICGVLIVGVSAMVLAACSRDPNVRKQKYFESGQKYFAEGNYRAAAIQFANAIQVDTRFAAAHYELARTYLQLGDGQHAYFETQRTLELQPDNYKAHADSANILAAAYASTSNPTYLATAKEHTDLLLEKQPNDPDTHLTVSNLLNVQQKYPEAIAEIKKAIALDPKRGDAYLALAVIETKTGTFDAAEADYKKAVELKPAAAAPHMSLAAFYQFRGRYPEAEQEVQRVISSDPKDLNARAAMAKLYISEGKKKEAEAFLSQVKRDFPNNSNGYRMLGDLYFEEGDTDRALAEYTSLHNAHPKELVVSKNYIQLLILKNRLDEADKLNEQILSAKVKDDEALAFRGEIQLRRGKVGEAIRTLQSVVAKNPDLAPAHYQLGLALSQQGELGQAVSEWQQAIRIQPAMTDAYRALAAVSLRKGDMVGLGKYASDLVRLKPAAPDGYAFRAISLAGQRRFAEAEADARKAIEVAPESSTGYVQMGVLTLAEGKMPAAESWYEQALGHDPNSLDALTGLSKIYLIQKRPDKAIARINAQIERSPSNSGFHDLLGMIEFSKGDLPAASTELEKSAELNRNNVDAIVKLGQVQTAMGNVDQALATWSEGARDNPKAAAFYVMSGGVYERKHDLEKAKSSYETALELKPNDPGIANNLAYVLLETNGDLDRALQLAQSARRSLPESPEVADTLGWALYQKGVYESAIGMFEDAIKLTVKNRRTENPTYHYHLGLAYEKAEKPELARQHFEHVLKIDPNYTDADDIRKQLAQLKS
ncbi:MAG: tetratricopeptide repeat protein [Acidobacteria bacterium]|nr:tetratricopeptide repeat protein [Acidobacteriota bacterium]